MKSILYTLGYVNNLDLIYQDLFKMAATSISEDQLENNLRHMVENEKIQYYIYEKDGNPGIREGQMPKGAQAMALRTGFFKKGDGSEILISFKNRKGIWCECMVTDATYLYNTMNAYRIGFMSFQRFELANQFICDIHKMLLPGEIWKFAAEEGNPANARRKTDYEILESYLHQIFSKLMLEYTDTRSANYGKIVFSDDHKYCYFNTGLLTEYAEDIYLMGEVYQPKPDGTFYCNNPQYIDAYTTLVAQYNFGKDTVSPGPDVVTFFHDIREIIYDASIEIDFTAEKLRHIIEDGMKRHRFPSRLEERFNNGDLSLWSLTESLKTAIKTANKIATRNYNYVIPQYRPAGRALSNKKIIHFKGKIQFLMPIFMELNFAGAPDFALVLSFENGFYIPETILQLSWAYNNARILCKPDASWLNPTEILLDYDDEEEVDHEHEDHDQEEEEDMTSTFLQTEAVFSAAIEYDPSQDPYIGKEFTLTQLAPGKNGGIKGVFSEEQKIGTISKKRLGYPNSYKFLQHYNQIEVIIAGKNPLGDSYQVLPKENDC